jgi:hypothetical protein
MDHKKSMKIGFICIALCWIGVSLVPLATADTGTIYFDWKGTTTYQIGEYNKAPPGFEYVIADVYVKNYDSDKTPSTNPWNWKLIVDGLKYDHDSATYDSSIGQQNVEVLKGAEVKTKIVFLIKGHPANATLQYDQLFGPTLTHIDYFNHSVPN